MKPISRHRRSIHQEPSNEKTDEHDDVKSANDLGVCRIVDDPQKAADKTNQVYES